MKCINSSIRSIANKLNASCTEFRVTKCCFQKLCQWTEGLIHRCPVIMLITSFAANVTQQKTPKFCLPRFFAAPNGVCALSGAKFMCYINFQLQFTFTRSKKLQKFLLGCQHIARWVDRGSFWVFLKNSHLQKFLSTFWKTEHNINFDSEHSQYIVRFPP